MDTGEIIRKRRLELGLSQEELGEMIGVQKSAIAKYKSGKIENLKRSTIEKLSQILSVSPTQLMGFPEEEPIPSHFSTAKEAMKFMLNQTVVMGFNGLDITKLSEEEQIQYANDMLDMMKLVSLKYKDKK